LQIEKSARQKLEIAIKRNFNNGLLEIEKKLEKNNMEPVPIEIYNY